MSGAKVTLSDAELALFQNSDLILTKNHILHQTKALLHLLQVQQAAAADSLWPGQPVFTHLPKISRGENYLGLPWLVLDYPRQFGREDIFAIRSFFWWGHFFSSTLQLSGSYALENRPRIAAAYTLLLEREYFLHIGADVWAHHFGTDNYVSIRDLSPDQFKTLLHQQPHIKIAAKWPLDQWPLAAKYLYESWELLLRLCMD